MQAGCLRASGRSGLAIMAFALISWGPGKVSPESAMPPSLYVMPWDCWPDSPPVERNWPWYGSEEPGQVHSWEPVVPGARVPGQFPVERLRLKLQAPESSVRGPSPEDVPALSSLSLSGSQRRVILSPEPGSVWRGVWLSRPGRGRDVARHPTLRAAAPTRTSAR